MKFQMKSTAKAVALGIVTLAASAAFATQTPVEFDLKGHDEFVKSLGKDAIAPPAEDCRRIQGHSRQGLQREARAARLQLPL